MCGIAGIYGENSPEKVRRMLEKIAHRGPDGQGIHELENATLGHTRLAILDVERGTQPMEVDGAWMVFNGEIYNYRQLARRYLPETKFNTHSDTEVMLHLYKKLGPRFVELLDGMFAFAIVENGELFMARDPLGIKSVYCGEENGTFSFASEIKALTEVTDQVREFPAGHWYHSRQGWHAFYRVLPNDLGIEDQSGAEEAIRAVLEEAVQKRMLADVPVGVSLSGGLDSSIVAMFANQGGEHLHSFVVGMDGSRDLEASQQMSEELGTQHHKRVYTE